MVGTSSWADPGFVEQWYPPELPARDRLPWYAERFEGVEVNSSFYALPEERTVERWAKITPDGFTFDVKLHRLLSRHSAPLESLPPDLRERARTTGRGRVVLDPGLEREMADRTVATLSRSSEAGKLSALLLQLTPAFSPHEHRLGGARAPHRRARAAPGRDRAAPPRLGRAQARRGHLRWYEDANAAFVATDAPQGDAPTIMPPVDAVTRDDLAYFRLHGRDAEGYLKGKTVAERFGWVYQPDELEEINTRVQELAGLATDTRVMFNNNRAADAPNSARAFREMLGQDPGPPPVAAQQRLV